MLLPRFCSMEKKREHSDDKYLNKKHPNQEDEIANILEIMEHNIQAFIRLAQYYYATDSIADYSSYTWEATQIRNAASLYTLIKYEEKDIIVQIGTWEFNTAVFTRKDIPELKWLSHGPLPLFVVPASANQDDKEKNPKKFLNEYAMIYSPKWWRVDLRLSYKQREHSINYGDSNWIVDYNIAVLALQNAEIHKIFPNENLFGKFVHKMSKLKEKTPDELRARSTMKEKYFSQDEEKQMFDNEICTCLWHISNENHETMYKLIQSFDIHKGIFTKSPIF